MLTKKTKIQTTNNVSTIHEWDEMENPEIPNVVDAETGHRNFGSGQIRSGSANKNPFEPRNASNIGSINPNPTPLYFSTGKTRPSNAERNFGGGNQST